MWVTLGMTGLQRALLIEVSEIFTGGVTNEGVTGKIEGQQDTSGVRDADIC